MPTIAEIRQQYPQYQDMSDADLAGALHKKFYSDMPAEEFNAKVGLAAPQPQQQPAGEWERATVLPFAKNTATGEVSPAVPGLLTGLIESGAQAVTAPYRAYTGDLQVTDAAGNITPEAIGEGLNFAGWATPASAASRMARAPKPTPAPKPLTEGQSAALAAERLGVDLPRAVASDRAAIQQTGKYLTNVPIGGLPLRNASRTAIDQLDTAAMRTQQSLGSGDVAKAGAMAKEGITGFSKNVLKGAVKSKYDAVDELVAPNVLTGLENTANVAAAITAKRQNANMEGSSKAVSLVQKALSAKDGMNYEGIKDLRTSIGELLDEPQSLVPAGISQGELERIYGALSDDLKAAVSRAGGEKASTAFEAANSFAARVAKERKALQSVLGNDLSDEKVFDKIAAMAGSTARADQAGLMRVRGAVGKEGWDEIASAVISKIGRDPDGNFTPDRFITGYGKLSEAGKSALFGGNKELASSLDDIVSVSRRFKQLNQYANPSGTAQNAMFGAGGVGLALDPVTTISTVAGSAVLSKALASPVSAKKLAAWAKAYEKAAANPTAVNTNMLGVRAKVLALAMAADEPALAGQVASAISGVRYVPAEPQQGNQGRKEDQNARPAQDLSGPEWF